MIWEYVAAVARAHAHALLYYSHKRTMKFIGGTRCSECQVIIIEQRMVHISALGILSFIGKCVYTLNVVELCMTP